MFGRTRNVVFALLGFSLLAGFFAIGPLLYRVPIGLDPSAFPLGPELQDLAISFFPELTRTVAGAFWLVAWALALLVIGFLWVRSSVRRKVAATDPGRRSFLTGLAAGSAAGVGAVVTGVGAAAVNSVLGVGRSGVGWGKSGAGVGASVVKTHPDWDPRWKTSRISGHRRFGRTEWNVSDIVLGTGQIRKGEDGDRIAKLAIDRGINYFDTSPDYAGAGSETLMGDAIRGVRDKLFIATKFCTPTGHLPAGTSVSHYVGAVEESLRRLKTDYVDLCHIHSVDTTARLLDENAHEAFDRLKQAGKVRFMGFSTHTPNLVEVVEAGIESGRFDVMMLAYHHGIWPQIPELIGRARSEQDMGVVAMKTLKGAKHHGLAGFRSEENSYAQAALAWALSNPDVSAAVISFFELQHVDEYLAASGRGLTAEDVSILQKYDALVAGRYCAPHCGACLDSCPEQVPIHDVLRHRMYFEDYGREKEALQQYARLDVNAAACATCSAPCQGSCPLGVSIRERAMEAHEMLTLA